MRTATAESRVTAIVTTYNAERYLPRCVESILRQTHPNVRIVIVDDCSTDGTAELAARYEGRVLLIRQTVNKGPAAGRTAGLMTVDTEYVTFLDADDYWEPTFVETTLHFIDEHPDLVAVSTANCKEDWNGQRHYRPLLDEQDKAYYGSEGAVCPNFYEFWVKYNAVLTGTVMMRTNVARETGGQREDLRLTEDLEFWGYLASFGAWGFIPQPLFVTDLRVLTPSERLRKFSHRYMLFRDLTVESWYSRIGPRVTDSVSVAALASFLGHIATEIALANAYTFRLGKSYRLAREWGQRFDRGLGRVLRYGSRGGPLLWPFVCIALRAREIVKSYLRPIRVWAAQLLA